jgi:ferredoxin
MIQQEQLQAKAKELLTEKKVDVVIGYGLTETGTIGAVFVTNPEQTDKLLWNDCCTANLTVYLKRQEIKKFGKPAVVVKGCDAKALAVLEVEKQINLSEMSVIGVECYGVQERGGEQQEKCKSCEVHQPPHCGTVIEADSKPAAPPEVADKYARLEKIMAMSASERFEYWKSEFSRCIKCYACRQNCPMCYCSVCAADKNRPVRIDTSSTLKGNFAWNILRAFHLAGRCVGCAACSSSCPAGIDLDLLNLTLSKTAKEQFNYIPGAERNTEPLIGTFSPEDSEGFIR